MISFTVVTRTRSGRTKTTRVETAFLHLKKTIRGTGRVLRGRSEPLVRQETWALLLAHNIIAALAARAALTAATTLPALRPPPRLLSGAEDSHGFGLFAALSVPTGMPARQAGRRRHLAVDRPGSP